LILCWLGVMLMGGCATEPFVTKTIKVRMEAHPEDYRRVEILPIWLAGQAKTDASLTPDDLKILSRQVGTNLLTALSQALTGKGYKVVHACGPLGTREDWEALEAETRRLLSEVRTNFLELSQEIYANRSNQKFNPCEYKADPSVASLQRNLGLGDADLIVLLDSKALLETPEARHKRNKWNWTGGAALTPLTIGLNIVGTGPSWPLQFSPCWMAHTILITDDPKINQVVESLGRSCLGSSGGGLVVGAGALWSGQFRGYVHRIDLQDFTVDRNQPASE